MKNFDLVAIGTGTAASAVASRCRMAGWQVAIVDSRPFGGTCALRGCDPKKVLVGAAEVIDWGRRMEGKGGQAQQLRIDWQKLMRFKRSFTKPVPKHSEEGFAMPAFANPSSLCFGTGSVNERLKRINFCQSIRSCWA